MQPHLILHKVRGKAVFDVAVEVQPGIWELPTTMGRAYPLLTWPLKDLGAVTAEAEQCDLSSVKDYVSVSDFYGPMDYPKDSPKASREDDLKVLASLIQAQGIAQTLLTRRLK